MAPRYLVTLAAEERQELEALTRGRDQDDRQAVLVRGGGCCAIGGGRDHAGVWPAPLRPLASRPARSSA
ncbi:MAG: hypothetical protein OXC19_19725 [Bryobacterales bacterium]|nr:hypothetical protein [Bryobacterales bacterium]